MYTAQEVRPPHAPNPGPGPGPIPGPTTTAQATPPDYGHPHYHHHHAAAATAYAGGYPGYDNTSSTYHQGVYTYNNTSMNNTYAQAQHQPSHSQHPSGYEPQSTAAPYQAGNSYSSACSSTEYHQAGASSGYYNNMATSVSVHGGYQNPSAGEGAYLPQPPSYPGQWPGGASSSYANYGVYSGSYPGGVYPHQDASSTQVPNTQYAHDYQQQWASYYASLQQNGSKIEDSDECTAPGTEPPAVEAKTMPYSQPPPPGTQPGWDVKEPSYADVNTTQVCNVDLVVSLLRTT